MGRSGTALEEVTSELRLEGREFGKSIPGGGNSIAISYKPVLSRNSESSVGGGGSQDRLGVRDTDSRQGWRGGGDWLCSNWNTSAKSRPNDLSGPLLPQVSVTF